MILTTMSLLVIAALGTMPKEGVSDGSNQTDAGAAADDAGGVGMARLPAVAGRYPAGGPFTGAVGSAVSVNAEGGYWVLGRMGMSVLRGEVAPDAVRAPSGLHVPDEPASVVRAGEAAGDGWWVLGRMSGLRKPEHRDVEVEWWPAPRLDALDELPAPEHTAGEAAPPAKSGTVRAGVVRAGVAESEAVSAFIAGYRSVSSDEATLQHMLNVVAPCEWTGGVEAPWYPGNGYVSVFQFHPDSWQRAGGGDPNDLWTVGRNVATWISRIGLAAAGTSSGWPHCFWR